MHRLRIYTDRQHLCNPSLTVLMKLSVDGHFDKSRFEKALYTLKNVHPLLYSSIRIDCDGEAYYCENSVERLELHCIKRECMKPLLVDAMYFAAYGRCDDKAAVMAAKMLSIDKPSSTAVSNLGRLSFDCQIGSCRIQDLVFFAPKAPVSYAVLGIATLGDAMQIGFSYDRKIISSDIMRAVTQ